MTNRKETAQLEIIQEPQQAMTPASMIELAIKQGADVDKLEKLMALYERWRDGENKRKFFAGLALFQELCPEITKDGKADFQTQKGRTTYAYATLPVIREQIIPSLKAAGLTYRWTFDEPEGSIKVTCIITHIDGHSEQTTMSAKPDVTGSKNEIQSRGSALTYLQRYTLIGALGLATAQEDSDGKKPGETGLSGDVKQALAECTTMDRLTDLWMLFEDRQNDKAVIAAFKTKKQELQKS